MADLCSVDGGQQADSIIVNFFSADSPTGMYRQLPTEVAAAALFLPQNNSTIFWDVVTRQLAPFEGGLELQSRLWQQCVTLKRAQQQALQEHSTMLLRRTGR
jgi:hypothetical protein